MVAHDPLHGSGQAELPHPALTSGDNAHVAQGLRRKSVRCQSRPTWNRNVYNAARLVGTP